MFELNSRSRAMLEPSKADKTGWPPRPEVFGELLNPMETAQYLRLDETGNHTPKTAVRTLNYRRDKGQIKASKFARRVWYLKEELDKFLQNKTEE